MTLPPEAQAIVDQLRAVLGLPPCQITISCDDSGQVQTIQPLVTYRREKPLDKRRACAQA